MTPETLLAHLESLPADAPLIFRTDDGPIQGGYHVTELKHARISSIDCGARQAQWDEAALQLLDGMGGDHMTVGKFAAILAQSIRHVAGLGPAPLTVEFGHGNRVKQVFHPGAPRLEVGVVVVPLDGSRAVCKPAQESLQAAPASCCGAAYSTCCA